MNTQTPPHTEMEKTREALRLVMLEPDLFKLHFSPIQVYLIAECLESALKRLEGTTTRRIHSPDAAKGLQRKHSKIVRGLDRVYAMLPADFRQEHFTRIPAHSSQKAYYSLSREALPFLFMGEARKLEVLWTARMIQETCHS